MPKLDKQAAKAVDEAESTFSALDEGIYIGSLAEVLTKEGPKGEYWSWRFTDLINIETDAKAPGSAWVNTSLSEDARWKLQEVFQAFGVDASTDTDELLGQQAQLVISQRVIERGARTGEVGNNVDRVMPLGAEE
jgi:hypothetical protein